ncbi:LPS-assembly lipoprotein LptE [Halocola ammonii]
MIRKSIGLVSLISAVLMIVACGSQRDNANGFAPDLKLKKATMQKSIPGAYSNLRSTRTYKITLSGNMPLPTKFDSLLVEDVRLPIAALQIGEGRSTTTLDASGEVDKLVLTAQRQFYNDEGPEVVEEIEYAKSGLSLEQGGVLKYRSGGQHYTLEIDKFEELEQQNNP